LLKETLATPAWRSLSHGARSLYTSLKARYNSGNHNNGRIYLSARDAHKEVGSALEQIVRWYRELQHFGFIVQTRGGTLGLNGYGTAPHWRLTELGCMREPPTRDFLKWDGKPFKKTAETSYRKRPRKTESRYGKPKHLMEQVLRKTETWSG
jgi:hypothetical protein